MNVLITGSAGRIGHEVATILLDRGERVIGFDVVRSRIEHPNFSGVEGSLSDPNAIAKAFHGVDTVLHIGALMTWKAEEQDLLFESNVNGTVNLLSATTAHAVERFLFASSGEVYPDRNPCYLPIDENHPQNPSSPYGLTKLLGEQAVRYYERSKGLKATILRFSHTQNASELLDANSFFSGSRFYLHAKIRQQRGFGNDALADLLESYDTGTNQLVVSRNSDGRPHRMGISDTRDTVSGILCALDSEAAIGETFNLAPPMATSFDEAIGLLQSKTGLGIVDINIPGPDLYYETDYRKAQDLLGYKPEWTFERMVEDAASSL